MRCCDCQFNHRGCYWNRCDLLESEYYNEYYEEPCPVIDENYIFISNNDFLNVNKGESAIDYMSRVTNDCK